MQLKDLFFRTSFLYNLIPVLSLMKIAGKKVILPFYHFVDDGANSLVSNLYQAKNTSQFIEDLHYFKKHFNSLSVSDFDAKEKIETNSFLLSFDDGLSNFYHVVAPILLKENVTAINFLNSNFIDNKALFYRYKVNILIDFFKKNNISKEQQTAINKVFKLTVFDTNTVCNLLKNIEISETDILDNCAKIVAFSFSDFLKNDKPYLSVQQIFTLIKSGFSFGAHSKSHPKYSSISLEKQLVETMESVAIIAEKFNLKSNYFSFPFSDDGVLIDFFEKIKLKKITTFGTAGLKDDDMENHYQRIQMERKFIFSAETIIKGELILYIVKRVFGKHKNIRN
tara:strand:+ start:663 stop:1676 length:1014 start_codon:yes stop_codon:yes gene_type:complete